MGNTLRNRRGGFDTPRQFYPAELHLGKRWQSRFRQSRPGGVTYTFAYDLRVAARERITVPAGTFDTWRIEARGWNVELGAALSRTIWVAPGVDADIAHETLVRLRNGNINQERAPGARVVSLTGRRIHGPRLGRDARARRGGSVRGGAARVRRVW